jgi:hypothetical protein
MARIPICEKDWVELINCHQSFPNKSFLLPAVGSNEYQEVFINYDLKHKKENVSK